MKKRTKESLLAICVGTLVGLAFVLGSYLFLRANQDEFGITMFIMTPFASGFVVAMIVRGGKRLAWTLLATSVLTCLILLVFGWEGFVCILMASPLIIVGMICGAFIGMVVRAKIDSMSSPGKLRIVILAMCPLLIAGADRVERPYRSVEQIEVFTSEIEIAAPPERVWDNLVELPVLDGPQPALLRIGLPVPYRCVLEDHAAGGRRVCYFNSGQIVERVTEWRKPEFMGMRITESTLPGRHWLGFETAEYELQPLNDGRSTRVVRRTTITTQLYPRWYWRPLERWGVRSEHAFVLGNIKRGALEDESQNR